MVRYMPGGIESMLNDKSNIQLVREIDREFFSFCVRANDWQDRLGKALCRLVDAGEVEFARNIDRYLCSS